jgi:adenine-specific DNA-methyltransferase
METILNQEIRTALKQFEEKYFIDETVNKQKVIQDLYNYDSELIAEMLNNDLLKENFTMQVAGTTIFQINNLIELFEADEFWKDSYTKYSKKIGLTSGGKFIDESTDVILDFPYKDTILKASMSKEDTDKDDLRPEEPFLNEVIAKEEIDVLLDKKIFVNAKKYSANGEKGTDNYSGENLIIKGNNLLALHTIEENCTGKVKLIYIDPPYNTGNDSFKYNDKFNHSTWLTFMKNRIEIAKGLLSEDGVLMINLDESEHSYLKVLCDGIFGRESFVGDIIWKKRKGGGNDSHFIALDHDYILVYLKNNSKSLHKKWKVSYEDVYLSRYKEYDEELGLRYYWDTLSRNGLKNPIPIEIETPDGSLLKFNSQKSKETIKEELDTGKVRFTKTRNGWSMHHKVYQPEDGKVLRSVLDGFDSLPTNKDSKEELSILFNEYEIFNNPKPEKLLKNLIELTTKEDDIVLDFFMGSGTTAAVAMKMNRKFIGIEQMDYTNTIAIPRLQKVIEGEQGGISKEVDWQGGGSFVYAELMEKNAGFLKSVIAASSMTELQEVFNRMLETTDFDFRVDLDEVRNTIWQLPIEDQKRIMIKIIDKNQLYYNYSEINDINVRDLISETDYAFNQSFYAECGE